MRKLLTLWIALAAIVFAVASPVSAQGFFGGCFNCGNGPFASGSFTPSCSQSSTFLAAATGVTLTADKTNYDTLICGLVSDGVWNFDVLYIWAAPDLATSKINLANPGTFNATTSGTVSFAAYQGFTGDGSTFSISSGFNPTTATSPNFVQNSATVGVYILTNRTTPATMWNVGCSVGGCTDGPLFSAFSNVSTTTVSINSTTTSSNPALTTQGAWNATRTTSAGEAVFRNSSKTSFSGGVDTSVAPTNANVIFFGFNGGFGLTTDQMAAGWIGVGVGGTGAGSGVNSCKINNRINTYMATLSSPKNVYSNSAC